MKKDKIRAIAITGMITAVAFLITFVFRFKVSFLTFDFKDAFIALLALMYGPLYGVASAAIVALLEFLTVSDTGVYGLIMNFLSSAAFASVCGLFYRYKRTLSGAVTGSIFAVFVMTAVMLLANVFITPFYMGVPRSVVIGMLPSLLLPFNLIKGVVNAAITMIIYKPVSSVFKKVGLLLGNNKATDRKSFILMAVISVIVIVFATLVILFILKGNFEFVGAK